MLDLDVGKARGNGPLVLHVLGLRLTGRMYSRERAIDEIYIAIKGEYSEFGDPRRWVPCAARTECLYWWCEPYDGVWMQAGYEHACSRRHQIEELVGAIC
jgi:hypothetical protein